MLAKVVPNYLFIEAAVALTTATATHKFAASCLVPAHSPHLTAAMSERTWRVAAPMSACGIERIFPSTQRGHRWVLSPLTSDRSRKLSLSDLEQSFSQVPCGL
jgi:hypothetical protein